MLSQAKIEEMARKHDVSAAAVAALAKAISLGGGSLHNSAIQISAVRANG